VVTGDTRNFTPDKSREEHVLKWTRKYLPDVSGKSKIYFPIKINFQATGPIRETKTCLYTMTNDRHFVVDSLQSRGYPNVLVCQGAGHAFK
jgi:sarcosine oxidase